MGIMAEMALNLDPITSEVVDAPGLLHARELELDRALMARPEVLAQKVEVELIKRLEHTAPWLLPMALR